MFEERVGVSTGRNRVAGAPVRGRAPRLTCVHAMEWMRGAVPWTRLTLAHRRGKLRPERTARAHHLRFVAMMNGTLAEAWRWDEVELDESNRVTDGVESSACRRRGQRMRVERRERDMRTQITGQVRVRLARRHPSRAAIDTKGPERQPPVLVPAPRPTTMLTHLKADVCGTLAALASGAVLDEHETGRRYMGARTGMIPVWIETGHATYIANTRRRCFVHRRDSQ